MAEKIKGELKVLKANDHGFYSAKIDNTWYGLGTKQKPAGVEIGDIVEGEMFLEKDKYKTITKPFEIDRALATITMAFENDVRPYLRRNT